MFKVNNFQASLDHQEFRVQARSGFTVRALGLGLVVCRLRPCGMWCGPSAANAAKV